MRKLPRVDCLTCPLPELFEVAAQRVKGLGGRAKRIRTDVLENKIHQIEYVNVRLFSLDNITFEFRSPEVVRHLRN